MTHLVRRIWRRGVLIWRHATSARFRSEIRTRRRHPAEVHQDTSLTWLDRYPYLFGVVQGLLDDTADARILSFGCATGEEVVTLRRYFPQAYLVGTDINATSLAVCRRRPADARTVYVEADRSVVAALGPFDAIFCMAVLQRRPHTVIRDGVTNIAALYPFERFEAEIAFLVNCLRPGGLLIVHHSQYRIADSSSYPALEPVAHARPSRKPHAQFHPSGRIIVPSAHIPSIYMRR